MMMMMMMMNEIIKTCDLSEIDREVDETTDVRIRIDEGFIRLNTYLNKHGISVERTAMQAQTMVIRPLPGIFTPPQQLNQAASESPSSQNSTSNKTELKELDYRKSACHDSTDT